MSKRSKGRVLLPALLLSISSMFGLCILMNLSVIETAKVDEYLFGERLIMERNIPYSSTKVGLPMGYSLVLPRYHSLPMVDTSGRTTQELFNELTQLPYNADQYDPNMIWTDGGNCQSFSIYLRTALERLGVESGFLPQPEHVSVWAVINHTLYRLDVVNKEFLRISPSDRLQLAQVYPRLGGMN